jgi:hypothetical protein
VTSRAVIGAVRIRASTTSPPPTVIARSGGGIRPLALLGTIQRLRREPWSGCDLPGVVGCALPGVHPTPQLLAPYSVYRTSAIVGRCHGRSPTNRKPKPNSGHFRLLSRWRSPTPSRLQALGPTLGHPHSSAVVSAVSLRELRPRAGRSRWRAFYRQVGQVFVIGAVGPEADVNRQGFRRAVVAAERRLDEVKE